MTDKAATNPIDTTPIANITNTDASPRTLGVLAGQRIALVGNELRLPNTAQGCALAVLLTGEATSRSRNSTLVVDRRAIRNIADLVELLTSVSLAIQEEPAETSPVLQLLLDFPLDRKEALKRAADPWVTIGRVTDWLSYLACPSNNFTNPAGMLNSRLRDHIPAPYNPSQQQPELEQQKQNQEAQQDFSDNYDYELPSPQPENPRLSKPVEPSGRSPAAIWQTAYGELQHQMPQEMFDTWLRPSRLIDYDSDMDIYTVGVRDTYAQEWLEHRLKKVIKRTLSQVAERTVELHFVVWTAVEPEAF
ncbi:MAG: hypothetical protein JXM73_13930 [Anaerolineae bacterium]|nr:hypothetical protein [Anaerolineae bacterium]